MNLPIKRGKQQRAQRIVIYGPEGIGKTTLAAAAPAPLFLDTEQGTGHLEVDRLDIENLAQIREAINALMTQPHEYKSIVLDTADNLWRLCADSIVAENPGWKDIETPGFGKGYAMASDRFRLVLEAFSRLISSGINVVIVSHAKVDRVSPPDNSEYSKYCIKVSASTRQAEASRELLKEWCDALLFCNYDTTVDSTKGKAKRHERVINTVSAPAWEAKNRYGLPDTMPMTPESIKLIFEAAGMASTTPRVPAPVEVSQTDTELLEAYFIGTGKLEAGQTLDHLPEKIKAALHARPEQAIEAAKKWKEANA